MRLGQWAEGAAALGGAKAEDPRALDDPAALFAWGRALGREGKVADAAATFRALLPRAMGLAPAERGKAEIEAALLAEAKGAEGSLTTPSRFSGRRGATRKTRCKSSQGWPCRSRSIARGSGRRLAWPSQATRNATRGRSSRDARARGAMADAGARCPKGDAIVAFTLGERDPAGARELWAKYLASAAGKGPWGWPRSGLERPRRAHAAGKRLR